MSDNTNKGAYIAAVDAANYKQILTVHEAVVKENEALRAQVEQLKPAYHQLKKAISAVEICGVPLHHLSYELSKHFDVDTVDFSKDMKIKNLCEFKGRLRKYANEKQPDDCSNEMIIGWKSAMFEVFSILSELINEESSQ